MRNLRLLLLACSLAHGSLYALIMPPWQAPDEVAHFVYARLMADLGRLPVNADAPSELEAEILASLARHRAWEYQGRVTPQPLPTHLDATSFSYDIILQRASLGYLPFALAVWPVRSAPLEIQLYVMRLASVLLASLVILLTCQLTLLAQPRRPALALASAIFVLLLPQHAFLNASVNDGNTTALAATVVILLLARLARQGLAWPLVAGVALTAAFAILSKATAYFLIPLLVLVGLLWAGHLSRAGRSGMPAWRRLLIAGGLVLALLGLATLAVLYAPRLNYVTTMLAYGASLWSELGPNWTTLVADGHLLRALGDTFRTFWASFGWVVVWLPAYWYTLLFALAALALLGLAAGPWVQWRGDPAAGRVYGVLALASACAIGVLLAWFIASPDGLNYYQGRYLFGAIAPLAALLVTGWTSLLPARARSWTPALVLLGMGALDVGALFGVALPYFYAW